MEPVGIFFEDSLGDARIIQRTKRRRRKTERNDTRIEQNNNSKKEMEMVPEKSRTLCVFPSSRDKSVMNVGLPARFTNIRSQLKNAVCLHVAAQREQDRVFLGN